VRPPRDISGAQLTQALARALDYGVTRQTGSHVRLTTTRNGRHHLTIPDHDPIRPGTMPSILRQVEHHHGLTREQVVRLLKL